MAYPGGYLSGDDDDDELAGFLSDDSYETETSATKHQLNIKSITQLTNEEKNEKLVFAIINGNLNEVVELLNTGIDVNVRFKDDWTPLLFAASVGNFEIVCELINKGADINADKGKYTVLMAACSCPATTSSPANCLAIVTKLIEKGVNLKAITRKQKTALMCAASNGNIEIVKKLISCCEINAVDNQGWNALFWAVNSNNPEIVQLLLETGSIYDEIDIRRNKPLFYAIAFGYENIVKLLLPETDNASVFSENVYDFENLFKNEKLQFFCDISSILYGMKSENLLNLFVNIDLLDFLSLTDEKLIELGVLLPFQRKRILKGLFKFHKHVFKKSSVHLIPKDSIYSTIDVSNSLLATIRQLITMEASLIYILQNDVNLNEDKSLNNNISNIRNRLFKLKKISRQLNVLTYKWDRQNETVDLITKNSANKRTWRKLFLYGSIFIITVVTAKKYNVNFLQRFKL